MDFYLGILVIVELDLKVLDDRHEKYTVCHLDGNDDGMREEGDFSVEEIRVELLGVK